MSWRELLAADEELTLPWLGGAGVFSRDRRFQLAGDSPPEPGWHRFSVGGGRKARWVGPADGPDLDFAAHHPTRRGYLLGDRIVPDDATAIGSLNDVFAQTERVHLVEPGLERFARAVVGVERDGRLIYLHQEFPLGPEMAVLEAWQDGAETVAGIVHVTPALDLAFQWLTWQKLLREERRAKRLAQIEAEQRRAGFDQAMQQAASRRLTLARTDFHEASRQALAVSGAEALDSRPGRDRNTMVVQFRFRGRRFECVVHRYTLAVLDSGICLTDYASGVQGDTFFTLESLPPVIGQAMDLGVLHVYRNVDDAWD